MRLTRTSSGALESISSLVASATQDVSHEQCGHILPRLLECLLGGRRTLGSFRFWSCRASRRLRSKMIAVTLRCCCIRVGVGKRREAVSERARDRVRQTDRRQRLVCIDAHTTVCMHVFHMAKSVYRGSKREREREPNKTRTTWQVKSR